MSESAEPVRDLSEVSGVRCATVWSAGRPGEWEARRADSTLDRSDKQAGKTAHHSGQLRNKYINK